jgi:hypothetical protein
MAGRLSLFFFGCNGRADQVVRTTDTQNDGPLTISAIYFYDLHNRTMFGLTEQKMVSTGKCRMRSESTIGRAGGGGLLPISSELASAVRAPCRARWLLAAAPCHGPRRVAAAHF